MTDKVSLVIYTTPTAKARARTVVNNGKVHSFTPQKTAIAEDEIRLAIVEKFPEPPFFADEPLKLDCTFYCPKPKSKKKDCLYPTGRPDADNFLKLLLDSGNNYLWHDDSSIVEIHVRKIYGNPPRIELILEAK